MTVWYSFFRRPGRLALQALLALGFLTLPAVARASAPLTALPRDSWLLRLADAPLWPELHRSQAAGTPLGAAEIGRRLAERAAAQKRIAAAATDLGAEVIDSYQLIFNGLLLHADVEQARQLADLPGVAGVAPAPPACHPHATPASPHRRDAAPPARRP